MHGSKTEELVIEEDIEAEKFIPETGNHFLEQDWHNIKPVLAVASGGLHAGMTEKLVRIMGKNIVAQYGGGVHWHPKGTRYGAMGVRQAIDAASQNISLEEYAKTHKELKEAIEKFGVAK
jgi:ribulose-bisphosphate carboxylase large chain